MQNIKDSFFIALRDRLAAHAPSRTITVLGNSRPAILVIENELIESSPQFPDAFYLRWGAVTAVSETQRLESPLIKLVCQITYWTQGSDGLSNQDRGRALAELDDDLRTIALPTRAALKDYSQSPSLDLGTFIFWTRPSFAGPTSDGNNLTRTATVEIFAHAEAA
jgi:hypothetical protein